MPRTESESTGNATSETHEHEPASEAGDARFSETTDKLPEANGESSVARQYSALDETQTVHQDSLQQIREDLREQRRASSELRSEMHSRIEQLAGSSGSGVNATELLGRLQQIEERLSQGQGRGEGRQEAILLRVSELERKIGEGTPDPLLNEIVHRLANIESNARTGGHDSRVETLATRVTELSRRMEQAGPGSDPRTDDVVLRIASLESAAKRLVQDEHLEALDSRLESVESKTRELGNQSDFQQLEERLSRLESEAVRGEDGRFDQFSERLNGIEEQTAQFAAAQRVADIQERLEAIEARTDPRIEALAGQIVAAENQLAEIRSDPRWSETLERVAGVEARLNDGQNEQLASRLVEVEQRLEEVPAHYAAIDRLQSRLADIEETTRKSEPDPRVDALFARVAAMEELTGRPSELDEVVRQLRQRLEELEANSDRGPDPRVAELATRLVKLESEKVDETLLTRITALEERLEDTEVDPHIADLSQRLASIEASAAEDLREGKAAQLLARLDALEEQAGEASGSDPRVPELAARLNAIERNPAQGGTVDPRIDEVVERLTALEQHEPTEGADTAELVARIAALEAAAGTSSSDDSRVESLLSRIEALEGNGSGAPDSRVTEIVARFDSLEKRLQSGSGAPAEWEEVAARVRALESTPSSGSESHALDELRQELRELQQDLIQRVHAAENAGPQDDLRAFVHQESERWTQWARNTLGDIGDLRQRVEKLSQSGGATEGVSGDASLSGAMKALGATITESLTRNASNDVKALRSQMYFVFFTIGMLYALGAFFAYMVMSQGG